MTHHQTHKATCFVTRDVSPPIVAGPCLIQLANFNHTNLCRIMKISSQTGWKETHRIGFNIMLFGKCLDQISVSFHLSHQHCICCFFFWHFVMKPYQQAVSHILWSWMNHAEHLCLFIHQQWYYLRDTYNRWYCINMILHWWHNARLWYLHG